MRLWLPLLLVPCLSVDVQDPLPQGAALDALPPDGGEEFNRLVFETSPYLRQHARNPVDWYPWGEEAFRAATLRKKPILLSIGYSTCHWCHVMERESFEDAQVAAILDETFVCIKVDREERPDIDAVYMQVTQAMTGRGGWPNTVLLTPEGNPFFAATYLPARGRYGNLGLVEICERTAEGWAGDREEMTRMAEEIASILRERVEQRSPGTLPPTTVAAAVRELSQAYDPVHGGFGAAPKFPAPHRLGLLLRHHRSTGHPRSLEMVERQLQAMRAGGLWDHVGHGFHRYATDERWFLPHFEKMLYDQALLATVYCEAYQVTGKPMYEATARQILAYVERELSAPEGGFWSAEDADSEGQEGVFYLWTPEQLEQALGAEDAALAAAWYGVEEEGNFEEEGGGEKTGASLLSTPHVLESFASERGFEPAALATRLEDLRQRLFAARETRVRPFRDDKVLTDWNGLAIAAFARAAQAFGDEAYAERAVRAAEFAWTELRTDEGRLHKLWRAGTPSGTGMLEDHAYLAHGFVELYGATFDARWLERALELCDTTLELFLDQDSGGLFLSPNDGETLILRPKEVYDGALPSGNSVAATTFLRLARLTGRMQFEERVEGILKAFAGDVSANPSAHAHLLTALDLLAGPTYELVLASPEREHACAALAPFQRAFLPHVALLSRPAGEDPPIVALAPWSADQTARDDRPTAYLCRDFTCEAPTTDLATVLERLRQAEQE